MTRNAQAANRYFEEVSIAINREGFQVKQMAGGHLEVLMSDRPLCEVNESGSITYRNENIATPEREEAKEKVFQIAGRTAEYMSQLEHAHTLKAVDLEDKYKVLSDFNGTVLAASHSRNGIQFVTWNWDQNHRSVSNGHYFMEKYDEAKQDFAIRSGLISKHNIFTPEQLIEIYRCCADTLDAGFELTYEQEKCIKSVQEQIEYAMPDIIEQIHEQDINMSESYSQEQTI